MRVPPYIVVRSHTKIPKPGAPKVTHVACQICSNCRNLAPFSSVPAPFDLKSCLVVRIISPDKRDLPAGCSSSRKV
jgi:hypothetical protein